MMCSGQSQANWPVSWVGKHGCVTPAGPLRLICSPCCWEPLKILRICLIFHGSTSPHHYCLNTFFLKGHLCVEMRSPCCLLHKRIRLSVPGLSAHAAACLGGQNEWRDEELPEHQGAIVWCLWAGEFTACTCLQPAGPEPSHVGARSSQLLAEVPVGVPGISLPEDSCRLPCPHPLSALGVCWAVSKSPGSCALC